MPSRRKGNKRSSGSKGNQDKLDAQIIADHHSGSSANRIMVRSDLVARVPRWELIEKPPLNYRNRITWLEETFDNTLNLSSAFTEFGFGYTVNSLPGISKIVALFDQYCIYSVMTRVFFEFPNSATAIGEAYGTIISALDYDSNNALSSFAAYQQYGTANEAPILKGMSYERYVKPVVANVTGGSNSTTNSGTTASRGWVNSAFPNVLHFGVRFGFQGNVTASTVVIRFVHSYVIGLRNNL